MRIAVLTDTHFGARNDAVAFSTYFKQFYDNVFFPYLRENGITRVLHCGDIFERRKYINFNSLYSARNYFFEPMRDFEMDLIVGNHDTFFKNTNDVNSPDLLLGEYDNIAVHSEPSTLNIEGVELAVLPWVCSDNYLQSIEFLKETRAQLLFGHLEIRGFEMHLGQPSHTGFETDLFAKFDNVYSGHFHHKSTRGNINYLGSPYELTWSDYNDPRGFHVFDTATRELTFVQNPYKMFHRPVYNDINPQAMEDWLTNGDFEKYTGRIVKLVIENKANTYLLDRVIAKLQSVNPLDLGFEDKSVYLNIDHENIDIDVDDINVLIDNMASSISREDLRFGVAERLKLLHDEAISQTTLSST